MGTGLQIQSPDFISKVMPLPVAEKISQGDAWGNLPEAAVQVRTLACLSTALMT